MIHLLKEVFDKFGEFSITQKPLILTNGGKCYTSFLLARIYPKFTCFDHPDFSSIQGAVVPFANHTPKRTQEENLLRMDEVVRLLALRLGAKCLSKISPHPRIQGQHGCNAHAIDHLFVEGHNPFVDVQQLCGLRMLQVQHLCGGNLKASRLQGRQDLARFAGLAQNKFADFGRPKLEKKKKGTFIACGLAQKWSPKFEFWVLKFDIETMVREMVVVKIEWSAFWGCSNQRIGGLKNRILELRRTQTLKKLQPMAKRYSLVRI